MSHSAVVILTPAPVGSAGLRIVTGPGGCCSGFCFGFGAAFATALAFGLAVLASETPAAKAQQIRQAIRYRIFRTIRRPITSPRSSCRVRQRRHWLSTRIALGLKREFSSTQLDREPVSRGRARGGHACGLRRQGWRDRHRWGWQPQPSLRWLL